MEKSKPQLRLNKFLCASLFIARRKADQLIVQNKVKINGKKVEKSGMLIDPKKDRVEFEGKTLALPEKKKMYIVFNKPPKVMSTMHDPKGRICLGDFFRTFPGVFPVGRLDWHSEGLILLTNDGDFSKRIVQRDKVPKTYFLKLTGDIKTTQLNTLKKGVFTKVGKVNALYAKILKKRGKQGLEKNSWVKVIISQGRNRQLHYMFESLGFHIKVLRRIKIGSFSLKGLKKGQARIVPYQEIKKMLTKPAKL